MRIQLALNVPDIDAAVDYYSKLFDTPPHKRREGYANFAIAEPPLKLVLFENPDADAHLHHIGVEVLKPDAVGSAEKRLRTAGLLESAATETQCCHATQEKLWSHAPDGLRWEWYRVTDDAPTTGADSFGHSCCTGRDKSGNIGGANL